jgi:hypothetical protein
VAFLNQCLLQGLANGGGREGESAGLGEGGGGGGWQGIAAEGLTGRGTLRLRGGTWEWEPGLAPWISAMIRQPLSLWSPIRDFLRSRLDEFCMRKDLKKVPVWGRGRNVLEARAGGTRLQG